MTEHITSTEETDALVLDLVEWVAAQPRPYTEVMEAWRTSCPRLTIWEDAVDQGLVRRDHDPGQEAMVRVTPQGLSRLAAEGRAKPGPR